MVWCCSGATHRCLCNSTSSLFLCYIWPWHDVKFSLLSQSQHWVSRQSSHTIVRKVSVSSHAYTLHRHSFKCQSNYRPDLNSSVFSLERDRIWRRMKSDAQLRYNIGILQVSDIICTTPITHDWWPKPLFGKSTGFFSSWPYVLASTIRFTVDCAQNFTSKYTRLNLPWYFCHVTKIFNNTLTWSAIAYHTRK